MSRAKLALVLACFVWAAGAAGAAGAEPAGQVTKGFIRNKFDAGRLVRRIIGASAKPLGEHKIMVEKMFVTYYAHQGTVWELEADRGEIDTRSGNAVCTGNVRLESASGEMVRADSLKWEGGKRRMTATGNVHAVIRHKRVPVAAEEEKEPGAWREE